MTPRFIKFDGVYPYPAFQKTVQANQEFVKSSSREEYYRWLISLRITYSDYYSYNLQKLGWEAEEFFVNDPIYIGKVAEQLFGKRAAFLKKKEELKDVVRPVTNRWWKFVIKEYIKQTRPDVLFIREGNPLESSFWGEFSGSCLVVNRIAMNFPKIWNPGYFDLIFTSLEPFRKVFEMNGIPSYIFYDGFDERILSEITETEKKYDVSHVGGAGASIFKAKTELLDYIAARHDLYWWGWSKETLPPALQKVYKGPLLGKEMFNVSRASRIVLNDYGNIAEGTAVNMRLYETLGIGSFLLTREAENLKAFPRDLFVTFRDNADCSDKISYFLKNEKEREEIALAGQKFALENITYREKVKDLDQILRKHLKEKFKK